MISFAIAAVLAPTPEIAFSARIYHPSGDQRISHHRVYVSDLDGRHRHGISSGSLECDGVRWIGRHMLSWLEGTADGASQQSRLILYDLRTGQRKVVARGLFDVYAPEPGWFPSAGWKRGEGLYTKNGQLMKLTEGRFQPVATPANPFSEGNDLRAQWQWDKQPKVELLQKYSGEYPSQILKRGHREHAFALAGRIVRLIPSELNPSVTWCLAGNYWASAGSNEWIYKLDWNRDTAQVVVDNLVAIDFQADHRTYAGLSPERTTRSLGKLRVWARDVIAGDTSSGKRWIVLGGLVHATSVSLPPGG
jgi:hypothetical protein